MFYFHGYERLALWLGNPNACGMMLAFWAIFLAGLCLAACIHSQKRSAGKGIYGIWLLHVLYLVILVCLCLTYSRGAYIGCACGLVHLAWSRRQKTALLYLALFCIVLLFLPQTAQRVASAAQISEGSISHRLWLWRGTCGIIAEYPWNGVGISKIGSHYMARYQPLTLDETYGSAISEPLSIAAGLGLPIAAIWLAAILFFLFLGILFGKNSLLTAVFSAGLATYLCGGFFNTLCLNPGLTPWIYFIWAGEIVVLMWYLMKKQPASGVSKARCLRSLSCSVLVSCLVWGGIFWYGHRIFSSLRHVRQTIVLPNGDCIPILAPALEPARGTLLVLNEGKSLHSPPSPFSAEKYGKLFQPQHWRTELFQILRPAVENGYAAAVISFPEYNDNIPDILNALKTFHDMPEPPSPEILVFAEGNLAVETLKAAARMEAEQNYRFIVKGIDEDSPWEENRLGALLPQCPFPVMVLPDDSKTDIPTILFTSTVD